MTEPLRVEMFNARRLEREHFEATDWGQRLLCELDVVVANSVFHAMRTGSTLYDDTINARVSDFLMPLDAGYRAQSLGIIQIDDIYDTETQAIARKLASLERGTMVIFKTMREGGHSGIRPGIGFDGWMSNGDGRLSRNSGHAFLSGTPRCARLEPRFQYGSMLSGIIYRQRGIAQNAIAKATGEAAKFTVGKKLKGQFHFMGRTWTSAVAEKFLPDYYSGGGDAWQVRFSKRGSARSFIMGAACLAELLRMPPVLPAQWHDDRFTDACLSLHEQRVEAAKAFWELQASISGLPYDLHQHGEWLGSGDILERRIRHMHGPDAGCFRVSFEPASVSIASSELTDQWQLPEAA